MLRDREEPTADMRSQLRLESTYERGLIVKVTVTAWNVRTDASGYEVRHCVGRRTRWFLRETTAEAWMLGQEQLYEMEHEDG